MMKIARQRLLSIGLAATLVTGATLSTGCFGTFPFARTLWEINKDISASKWVQWIVFLGLSVVPVYEAAVIIDLFVGNSLEFWSGEAVMSDEERDVPDKKVVGLSDERAAVVTRLDDKHMRIEIVGEGEVDREFILDGRDGRLLLRDGTGALLGAAGGSDEGGVLVTDEQGRTIEHHDARSVERLRDNLQQGGPEAASAFAVNYRDPWTDVAGVATGAPIPRAR